MPIQDDQTAHMMDQGAELDAAEANVAANDMRAILQLIATQLEDSDRRQSVVLGDMHRRLAEMSNDARQTRANVPAAFAPAFERIQQGIEQLADLVASAEGHLHAVEVDEPATSRADQPTEASDRDESIEAAFSESAAGAAPVSSMFPSSSDHPVFTAHEEGEADTSGSDEAPAEDLMITDNAADRFEFVGNHESNEPASGASDASESIDAIDPKPQSRIEPPVFVTLEHGHEVHADVDENWDELAPWNRDQAEALTRVYEAHDAEDAARAADVSHHGVSHMAMLAGSQTEKIENVDEARFIAATGEEDNVMLPQEPEAKSFHQESLVNVAPVIEQAWLEDRFAEIAAKIEESIFELRDDQTLLSLSDRFGEFEERVGLALEDVATRHDVDALKSAESQIDSMVGYFERVAAQLGRIDSLESQVEALLERFTDDNLMLHFAGQRGSTDSDLSGIAEAAAESVAQRFLADLSNNMPGAEVETAAIVDMRQALEVFISERRERDDEAAGMLDTIQQALIRVLDRVEVLESGYENPPMTSPLDIEFVDDNEPDAAPEHDSPPVQRPRPEPDYSQARLEYPAAVRDNRSATEPPHAEPQPEALLDMGVQEHAVEAFEDDAFSDPLQSPAEEEVYEQPIAHSENDASALDAQPVLGSESDAAAHTEPAWDAEAPSQHPVSPIDRLRQEFIADARRAREHAAQQALLAEAAGNEQPARKKISVPGLASLGAKVRGAAKSASSENESAKTGRAQVVAGDDSAPSRSRYAMSRSKILVGAVIVLFATAGALLMMRSPTQPIADAAAPPAMHQTFENGTSGPELSGPEETAPAMKAEKEVDRQGSLEGGRVYDGEFHYDGPAGTEGRPFAKGLAGVAVADLDKAPNPAAVAKARRQQRLAKMSSDLGAAAAYATPAALMPDNVAANPAAHGAGSVSHASDGNHLDLPPATVGPLSLRLAAAKGDPSAQFEVAARLAGGTGTQQDLKGAVKWYQMAAAQGFAQAQYRLGTLYERGLGVDKDLARAGVWYERAAEKGNVKAMHNLAVVSAGRDVGGPDYESAAKWFDAAAQYGLSDSQFNMAVLYENGLGIEKDLQRAYVNYALASTKGDAQAKARHAEVSKMLSKDDREAAERRVKAFRPKRADRLVNDARVAGEDWKKRADHAY